MNACRICGAAVLTSDHANPNRDEKSIRWGAWGELLGLIAAWAWTVVAGGGGLLLLFEKGPWPLTNGWFALLSGMAACPLASWLLEKSRRSQSQVVFGLPSSLFSSSRGGLPWLSRSHHVDLLVCPAHDDGPAPDEVTTATSPHATTEAAARLYGVGHREDGVAERGPPYVTPRGLLPDVGQEWVPSGASGGLWFTRCAGNNSGRLTSQAESPHEATERRRQLPPGIRAFLT